MSLCLIARNKDHLWIGADTAISRDIDGKSYRVYDEFREKVFCIGDNIIFCSGLLFVSDKIKDMLLKTGIVDIDQIQKYVRELVEALPPYFDKKNHQVGIIVCKGNGEVISMTQEQGFEIILHKPPETGAIQILTGGFRSDEAHKVAGNVILRGENVINIFGETFSTLADNCIGGDLILYHRDYSNTKIEKRIYAIKEPKEKLRYCYNEAQHCYFHGLIQASDFQDLEGNSMLTSDYKFSGDFIDAKGIIVVNPNDSSKPYFEVSQDSGKVQMNDATISGNITMTGGSISWSNVNSDPVATSASSTANSAASAASTAASNIKKLADGTYSGGTFIDGTMIASPNIVGGKILGGEFMDLGEQYKLVLNYNENGAGALNIIKNSSGEVVFTIYNGDFGYTSIGGKQGQTIFSFDSLTNTIDFGNNTVKGVTAVFA